MPPGRRRRSSTSELVHAVLNLRARILEDPVSGAPLCIPLDRAPPARAARRAPAAPFYAAASRPRHIIQLR